MSSDAEHLEILRKYYLNQVRTGRGPGAVFYRGSRMQRGGSFGSILTSIMKSPMVRKGLAYGAKTALNTAGDVISNLSRGDNFKTASLRGFAKQRDIQKRKAIDTLKSLVSPNRPKKKRPKRRRHGRLMSDNFGSLRR